jgi:hypothetical protein
MAEGGFFNLFRVREKDNLEFWVSHAIVLLSTVLGVYLAASAGYDSAVRFEKMQSNKAGFHMRRALSDELSDNLKEAQKWTGYFLEGDAWRFEGKPEDYPLQTYVWDAMKANEATLALNPKILTEIRRFYRATQLNVRDMVSGSSASRPAAEAIRKDIKRMQAEILPLLAKDTKDYGARVAADGS